MREDLERLDRLLEHRVRLAVCVLLSRYDRLSFSKLKELTDETDGNLGANLKKLEDEGARPTLTWRVDNFTHWPQVKNLVPHNNFYNYGRMQEVWLDK